MFSPEFFWLIIYLRLPLVRCRTLFIIYFRYSVLIEMELIYLWIASQSLYKSLLRESFLLNYSRKLGLFKLIDWIIFLLIKLYFVIYLLIFMSITIIYTQNHLIQFSWRLITADTINKLNGKKVLYQNLMIFLLPCWTEATCSYLQAWARHIFK